MEEEELVRVMTQRAREEHAAACRGLVDTNALLFQVIAVGRGGAGDSGGERGSR